MTDRSVSGAQPGTSQDKAVSQMEAGRELDALVAEKVMGWKLPDTATMRASAERVWASQPQVQYFYAPDGCDVGFTAVPKDDAAAVAGFSQEGARFEPSVPRYSSEIAAAWPVLQKLADGLARCYYAEVAEGGIDANGGRAAHVRLYRQGDDEAFVTVAAATAPEAICRAALLAVGEVSR